MAARALGLDPPVGPDDHVLGPASAPGMITLVQYGGFECPLSNSVRGIVRDVREAFPERVRVAFRHFPLREHAYAVAAAVAADEAGRQGAFWIYHDRLFEHAHDLAPGALVGHAEALGLDAAAVRAALADPAAATAVLASKRAGVRAGVRSSLNLFVDGTLYEDRALDEALAECVIRPLRAAAA